MGESNLVLIVSLSLRVYHGHNMSDDLSFSDLLVQGDDEIKEIWAVFAEGKAEVPEENLGKILASMGVTPTKDELDRMNKRFGDNDGTINYDEFKKMISTRSTTEQDEKELMAGLTYFANLSDKDGKVDTSLLCGAIKSFNPDADDEDETIAKGGRHPGSPRFLPQTYRGVKSLVVFSWYI